VFAYGTLRGDYSEDGDRWGVIESTGASWSRGTVKGFRLYQEKGCWYPFAAKTGQESDVIVGTLLEWQDKETNKQAEDLCNNIEGFNPNRPDDGLYRRCTVQVHAEGRQDPVQAYIYHQTLDAEKAANSKHVPTGDWLLKDAAKSLPVFAYGTLRGDFSKDGDKYGVIKSTCASWARGTVKGFRLYQEEGFFYPFAAKTDDESDVIVGTLLEWQDEDMNRKAEDRCNRIEGFDPNSPDDGLYRRCTVQVHVDGRQDPVQAYIYHQSFDDHSDCDSVYDRAAKSKHFPSGDWLLQGSAESDSPDQ